MKPSSSPPPARRSARPIAARSTTPTPRRSADMPSPTRSPRAEVDLGEVDDVVMGAALQQGSTGYNIARQCALRAGLPTSVAGMSVDRQCASGLMAIAIAAKEIVVDGMNIAVGGGLEFDLAGAERQDEPLSRAGSVARRAPATTSTCRCSKPPRSSRRATRSRARSRTNSPCSRSAHRGRAGRRAVRRRDRSAADRDEGRRQGDGRRFRQAGHAEARRGHSRRHDARRASRR